MTTPKPNQMWGGRFSEAPSDIMVQINASIDVDKRLYRQDIQGSVAHCEMLVAQEILTADEGDKITKGLAAILAEIESGKFVFKTELEDIHMNIESRLAEMIGDVAGKLHTARSRNDQVATDMRLWTKQALAALIEEISVLQSILDKQSGAHAETVMPGFTHLQIAQPVTLGLHLQAYFDMLERDKGRFADCLDRMNESPLGACALAGTRHNIDRDLTAEKLGFRRPVRNTMDAVAARDYLLEFLSASSICIIHLSRLAEELILWSTVQFGFIRLGDKFTTGSSIMPQKKNPDAAELVRGKSGGIIGNLMQLLMVMKALPLTYNKDMQEDKTPVFETYDALLLCLQATTGMIDTMHVNKERMHEDAESGYSTATYLADWLVKNLNIPFRQAHHITGQIVQAAEKKSLKLHDMPLADMQQFESRINKGIFDFLRITGNNS
ncbi:MAG: argininosuccinate lyase [Micavibrio sp.]|nr:argininosuccinate lyase [Micavibrio sp.]